QTQLDVEHLLLALVEQPEGVVPAILERLGVDPGVIRDRIQAALEAAPRLSGPAGPAGTVQVYITPRLKRGFAVPQEESARLRDDFISTEHLFVAILRCAQDPDGGGPAARVLADYGVELEQSYRALAEIRGAQRATDAQAESRYRVLERYSTDLTALARAGKLDPVVGREAEVRRVMQVLARRSKNNPALIGEPGVGKT